MRVLFAEDERALSHALTTILERNSYEVEAVYDGSSALDCLLGNEYDVAVLDIMMPNMNGLEVLRFARSGRPYASYHAYCQRNDRRQG